MIDNNNMISFTERDPEVTWADIKPTRKVSTKVRAAVEKYEIAQRVYDEAIDYCLDNGEWDQEYINDLAHILDREYENMLEAKHKTLNCPHQHVSTRGGMHFDAGEVWDDIQEICDNCGKVW
jgi:hypothetical protein